MFAKSRVSDDELRSLCQLLKLVPSEVSEEEMKSHVCTVAEKVRSLIRERC